MPISGFEPLQLAHDQRAMCPRARERDVEVIAVRLGAKAAAARRAGASRRASPSCETALSLRTKRPLRRLRVVPNVVPLAVDEQSHRATSACKPHDTVAALHEDPPASTLSSFARRSSSLLRSRSASPRARCRRRHDDQAHGCVEPADDARLGRRDAHARRARARPPARRARQPVRDPLDGGVRRLAL